MPSRPVALPCLVLLLLLAAAPAASQSSGSWVERPDEMVVLTFYDRDLYEGNARFLYTTHPSLEQARSGDWSVNVYVVTVSPAGELRQNHIYSGRDLLQAGSDLALRRGHDQVIVEQAPTEQGQETRLELWSATDGSVISTTTMPSPRGPDNRRWQWTGISPTPDGNFLRVTSQFTRNDPTPVGTAAWLLISPSGEVLRRGAVSREHTQMMVDGQFATEDGSIGLVVTASTQEATGLTDTDLDVPVEVAVADRVLEARVYGEKRVVLFTPDGQTRRLRPVLERQLMWGGEMSIPQDLPPQEMMEQNREQMTLVEETEIELRARHSVEVNIRGTRRGDLVVPDPEGFATLLEVTANRRREPPVHGLHYVVFATGEGPVRDVYLEPLVEDLRPRPVEFVPRADGGLVLLTEQRRGDARARILWISASGSIDSNVAIREDGQEPRGLVEGPDGAWIVGEGMHDGKTRLWVRRVDPG